MKKGSTPGKCAKAASLSQGWNKPPPPCGEARPERELGAQPYKEGDSARGSAAARRAQPDDASAATEVRYMPT